MSVSVLAFGEILWDIIGGESFIGGAPLNFAVHFSQLGGTSAMISAVGNDSPGDRALTFLKGHGVVTEYIGRSEKATGEVPVVLTGGIPTYEILENRAWDDIPVTDSLLKQLGRRDWDVFYFGTLAQRSFSNRDALKKLLKGVSFKEIFLDVNLRQHYFSKEILSASLEEATILKLNDEEVEVIGSLLMREGMTEAEIVSVIQKAYDLPLVIVTLGANGARLYGRDQTMNLVSPQVKAVDTVGAGDSFAAAFLYSFMTKGGICASGELALKVAAYVVTHQGGVKPYPEDLISL